MAEQDVDGRVGDPIAQVASHGTSEGVAPDDEVYPRRFRDERKGA